VKMYQVLNALSTYPLDTDVERVTVWQAHDGINIQLSRVTPEQPYIQLENEVEKYGLDLSAVDPTEFPRS
jgi:hypothetical protein